MKISYLFLPEHVKKNLKLYPCISEKLPHVLEEGIPSEFFSKVRKSQRQIYRILSNQHYPNLVNLLKNIEVCLANGYTNLDLLKIRDTSQFSSAISEVKVASSLINRGFVVKGFDQNKNNSKVPDIYADNNILSFVAEIYMPRDLGGLNLFVDDVWHYFKNLDVQLDYYVDIKYGVITNGTFFKPLFFDPLAFSQDMDNKNFRLSTEKKIFINIKERLQSSSHKEIIEYFNFGKYNLQLRVKINNIKNSESCYPDRLISCPAPSLSGYQPRQLFRELMIKISKKINKGQVYKISGQHLRMLIVDISELLYARTGEFEHSAYLPSFKESLYNHFSMKNLKIDLVVFCLPTYKNEIKLKLVLMRNCVDNCLLFEIFGRNVEDHLIVKVE